ncbi:MAG: serine protease [Planctomycetota bacterium]
MTYDIDSRLVRVAKVLTFNHGRQIGNATAFFFLRDGFLYLITNRHVVCDTVNQLFPDRLQVRVHDNPEDLTSHGELWLDVLDDRGRPRWREHPALGAAADVVAIPINDPMVIANWHVDTFGPEHLLDERAGLPLGQEVIVIGFPLGFEDTLHRLPLIRRATIASVYPLPFKGERYFITDARLHRGSSGSPVVAKIFEVATENTSWKLLGVHSASLDVSNRDPDQDEKLGLNMTWYASLIMEMTERSG